MNIERFVKYGGAVSYIVFVVLIVARQGGLFPLLVFIVTAAFLIAHLLIEARKILRSMS